jgi:F-type H+-transporting ATPase subunit delta
MSDLKISRRYAKALFDFAIEEKLVSQINDDMTMILSTCNLNKDFIHFLKSPVIRPKKKLEIIQLIFGDKIQKITSNFIKIIATHRRDNLLPTIAQEYSDMYKESQGIKVAYVKTAVELDEKTSKMLVDLLEKQIGSKIQLDVKVRKDLIGGLVLTVDNKEIDSTIKSKLIRLRSEFDSNPYERKF